MINKPRFVQYHQIRHLYSYLFLIFSSRLMEVLDKGKAAAVTSIVETIDKASGKVIFENQSTVFIRGSGGFGGKRTGSGKSPSYTLYFSSVIG